MDVSEVLLLPSFEGAQVIAGKGGLTREVTTANVVEAPDIKSWGKPGQLLISSFYAFENLSDQELREFFETAESIGVGGIVFKPERLVAEAPHVITELCDEFKIALIRVTAETKYEGLLLDVLGHFLDSSTTLLNRFYELHRQSMVLALRQPTILEIILNLRNQVHCDITFFDSTKDRRTTTSQELSNFTTPRFTELPGTRYRTYTYYDASLVYPDIKRRATAVRIPSSDDQIYYLILHIKNERLTSLDDMAVGNVVSLLQMEILKQNAIDRKLFFQNNSLVHELLVDDTLDDERTQSALTSLGINTYPHYELLLARIDLDDQAQVDRREDVLLMVRRRLKMLYPEIAYYQSNDTIIFLHNVKNDASKFSTANVRAIMTEVQAVPANPSFGFFAALSSLGTRHNITELNHEVAETARFFDSKRYRNSVMRYDELGVYKLLMQAGDISTLTHFTDPRVARLHNENIEFFDTAATLCENNLNYQETARQLYLHPKTIRYRAERVEKLYGIDFHNPDDRLQLALSARVFQLLETPAR